MCWELDGQCEVRQVGNHHGFVLDGDHHGESLSVQRARILPLCLVGATHQESLILDVMGWRFT